MVDPAVWFVDTRMAVAQQWFSSPFVRWRQLNNQSERLARAEDRLAKAVVDQASYVELQAKVAALESMSLRIQSGKKAERLAQLVDLGDRVLVTAGSRDNVFVGQIITDKDTILVGRIKSIGLYMSEVELLSDPTSKVPVQTTSGTARGILEGEHDGKAQLSGVLQSELITEGDVLITAGSANGYPAGLVVGQIGAIIGRPEDVTKGGTVSLMGQRNGWVALW
jgi:rod shape-determining protein MreC